jgi:sulfite oxidase
VLQPAAVINWEIVHAEKDANMRHVLDFPCNGEPPPVSITVAISRNKPNFKLKKTLGCNVITRNTSHFVRNHGNVPYVDIPAYELEIGGVVKVPRRFHQVSYKMVLSFLGRP